MNKTLPLTLVLTVLLVPTVSADWDREARQYSCNPQSVNLTCVHDLMLCVEDAPPQVVDLVLHCATVTPDRADRPIVVATAVVDYAYFHAELQVNLIYNDLDDTYEANRPDLTALNNILCDSVWSHFCTTPLETPEWQEVSDPLGPNPY